MCSLGQMQSFAEYQKHLSQQFQQTAQGTSAQPELNVFNSAEELQPLPSALVICLVPQGSDKGLGFLRWPWPHGDCLL